MVNDESILTSIKKLLGIEESYEHFDQDLVIHINSVFMILNQLGLGPKEGFNIVDKNDKWSSFLGTNQDLSSVISYVYLKVRLMFDPPQMGYLVTSIQDQCKEFEFRLNVQTEDG